MSQWLGVAAVFVSVLLIAVVAFLAWAFCRAADQAEQRAAELAARRDGAMLRRG